MVTHFQYAYAIFGKNDNWGARLNDQMFHISVMAGLIVEILLCCSPFLLLCNRLKISEYEAHWQLDFH